MSNISSEKMQEMTDYAKKLRRKFPHIKPNRIMKKTAEYFRVKLTKDEGNSQVDTMRREKINTFSKPDIQGNSHSR